MSLAVLGGSVVGDDGVVPADIVVRNGRVDEVGPQVDVPSDARVLDARGLLVAPGFWDLQVNGGTASISPANPNGCGSSRPCSPAMASAGSCRPS